MILVCVLLISVNGAGQELPPIEKFMSEDFRGENQNWMITQGENDFMYVANNKGLLEFNGAKWNLYPSPNGTIIRSVRAIGKRVYTGCYMEFGYWEKDLFGRLRYNSISETIKERLVEDEQFWTILPFEKWLLFQSANRIYMLDTLKWGLTIIESKKNISKLTSVGNAVYYNVFDEGIYKIEEGRSKLVLGVDEFHNHIVTTILPDANGFLLHTQTGGFFRKRGERYERWKIPADTDLNKTGSFCSIRISDGSIMVGTISDGIYHLSGEGEIIDHVNQKKGLTNNTVLSLFEDRNSNIWAGLDNGINCMNIKSPLRIFIDEKGETGAVYASLVSKGFLYLGTNQGLFYKPLSSKGSFSFVKNTNGQVWSLTEIEGEIFCSHHKGTLVIRDGTAVLISDIPGTWGVKAIPGRKDTLIQGNYSGLSLLVKKDGKWRLGNKIRGFSNSARYFEIDSGRTVWINHEYKGVFRLRINENFDSIYVSEKIDGTKNEKNSGLIIYRGSVLYAHEGGVFSFSEESGGFVRDTIFSQMLDNDQYISGKMIVDDESRLWTFTQNNICYFNTGSLNSYPSLTRLPIMNSSIRGMVGFENITHLEDNIYLIGTVNGYVTLDLSKLIEEREYTINLNSINLRTKNNESFPVSLSDFGIFESRQNSFTFEFSVPDYERYYFTEFQYKLIGFYDEWSPWQSDNSISFENLPFGEYELVVRGKAGDQITTNTINYQFRIKRPPSLSNFAIGVYLVLFVITIYIVNVAFRRYYLSLHQKEIEETRKSSELRRMETEKEIMLLKNEQLRKDIEGKSRELAISTMSMIKKNELLSGIKAELMKLDSASGIKSVIRLIDKNMSTKNDWLFFEEAFNNADKDFFRRIKERHPELTPNDLRMCAYLRLNLSSKEIAPLLNISVRSVEIKRYRLRLKMKLIHDKGLVEYILSI